MTMAALGAYLNTQVSAGNQQITLVLTLAEAQALANEISAAIGTSGGSDQVSDGEESQG